MGNGLALEVTCENLVLKPAVLGDFFLWAKGNISFSWQWQLFTVLWLRRCAEPQTPVCSQLYTHAAFRFTYPAMMTVCEQNPSESYYLQSKSLKCSGI